MSRYLNTANGSKPHPRNRRGEHPDAAPRGSAGGLDAVDRQAGLEEGIGSRNQHEQCGAADHDFSLCGPAPEVPAHGLGEGGARGVEPFCLPGLLGRREDKGARGEPEGQRHG